MYFIPMGVCLMAKEIFKVTNTSYPFQDQVNVTDLTTEDVENVSKIITIIDIHIDEVTDQFYKKILSIPQLKAIIEEHSTVDKLKQTLKRHIQTMFTKNLDDNYLAERNQIALIHYLVKLEPKWYIAGFQYLSHVLQTILIREVADKDEAMYLSSIISKYISLEMQIVLEAYENKVLSNLEIDELLLTLEREQEMK